MCTKSMIKNISLKVIRILKIEVAEIAKFLEGIVKSNYYLCQFHVSLFRVKKKNGLMSDLDSKKLSLYLRCFVRAKSLLKANGYKQDSLEEQLIEIQCLIKNQKRLQPMFTAIASKRVLYAGQAYYNAWYLSRSLRKYGWKADVLNWDLNPKSQIYYHGEDCRFYGNSEDEITQNLSFYIAALYEYDVFHFSNANGICFGFYVQSLFKEKFVEHSEIFLLKALGKKIVYSNSGCHDGVSQTSFAKWGPQSACSICRWQNEPTVCSDVKNLTWGRFRNNVADFQCTLGGNRVDYNDDPRVHEVPEFYCLEPDLWHPQIQIPKAFLLPTKSVNTTYLYHAVGNKTERTINGINIKSSHVYMPLIEKLKQEGLSLELIEPSGVPNEDVRFFQVQADIFLEMLTFGWFGANAREAMMLAKPVICYIRPEWLESVRQEIPDYAAELPIISATPDTVEEVLRDLIASPDKRRQIGQQGREFAIKWHSAEAGGRRFDQIYSKLLQGDPLLRIIS